MSISVEEFKGQHKLKIPDNFILDSATLFFSIPGQQYIKQLNYYPNYDSINFSSICNLLVAGSWVSFRIMLTEKFQKKQSIVDLGYIFYGINKIKKQQATSASDIEFKRLSGLNYISGTIYFSGTYFPNVITFRVNDSDLSKLRELFYRCAPGSKITFEDVLYKDKIKGISKLNETFEME